MLVSLILFTRSLFLQRPVEDLTPARKLVMPDKSMTPQILAIGISQIGNDVSLGEAESTLRWLGTIPLSRMSQHDDLMYSAFGRGLTSWDAATYLLRVSGSDLTKVSSIVELSQVWNIRQLAIICRGTEILESSSKCSLVQPGGGNTIYQCTTLAGIFRMVG
jgi:hypothetical protein